MKLIFEMIKKASANIALEQDVQDGKTFKEHEHEFYVEIDDLEQLKNAESMDLQEQWNIKISKSSKNAAKGALRIRQIIKGDPKAGWDQRPEGEPQYVLNTKVDQGVGRRLEVPVPTTVDAFNLFAMLSESGMIKHRYHFPVGDLVFEVDMFVNPEGGYHPVAKIDLEVKSMDAEIPELPIQVKSCIKGDTTDAEERKKITEYFDKYFITKNKFDADAVTALESLSIAQEATTTFNFSTGEKLGFGFLAVLFAAKIFMWGHDKWKAYVKNKNKDLDVFDEEIHKVVRTLKNTFLNDAWVSKQTFKTGDIAGAEIAKWLSVNGKFNPNPIETINDTLATIARTETTLFNAYVSFVKQIQAIVAPVEALCKRTPPEPKGNEAYTDWCVKYQTPEAAWLFEDMEKKLRALHHPAEALWNKLPNSKNMVGGLVYSVNDKYSVWDGDSYFKLEAKPSKVDAQVPAFTAAQAKEVAKLIIKFLEVTMSSGGGVFHPASQQVSYYPCPQDGWPETNQPCASPDYLFAHAKIDSPMFETTLFKIGTLNEQFMDPIYVLESTFRYVSGQVVEALLMWLQKSVEVKRGDGDHEYR